MSEIVFLRTDNFVFMGSDKKTLGINIPGLVLVFFKMNGDQNCNAFEPVFANLTRVERRISYGILDASSNKSLIQQSRNTTTPITAVPQLYLYVNGAPHSRFTGTKNVESLRSFINKALSLLEQPPQTNIYGSGPRPTSQTPKTYQPEVRPPSLKGVLKGGAPANSGIGLPGFVEDDSKQKLLVPDTVVPWNTPWDAELKESY